MEREVVKVLYTDRHHHCSVHGLDSLVVLLCASILAPLKHIASPLHTATPGLLATVAQKGHTCKLKMLVQIKSSTCRLKILPAN